MQMHRRRLLRRQRGTAILEGVVVIATLSLLLAAGVFFHRKYVAELTHATEARAAAWTSALAGCNRKLELTREVTAVVTRGRSAKPHAVVTDMAALSVDGAPALIRRASGSSGAVVVPCNELDHLDRAGLNELEQSLVRTLLPTF